MAVIALMGIDGCGKSTLGRALAERMGAAGEPADVRWVMLRPFLLRPFIVAAKFLLVRKAPKSQNYAAHIEAKRSGMAKLKFAHSLYLLVMLLDYLPQAWFKLWWPRLRGRHVICDRYFHDMALDYAITVNGDAQRMLQVMALMARFLPRPDLHYHVKVPPEVAFARKDDVPSISYLQERDALYAQIAQALALPALNGQDDPAANSTRILSDLRQARDSHPSTA
jgi:thymidylate kinase